MIRSIAANTVNTQLAPSTPGFAAKRALSGVFEDDYRRVVGDLRLALRELLIGAGGDPSRPQSIARGFGLDKNLAWKVSRLVEADDDVEALRFLPGPPGRRILLEAFGSRSNDMARVRVEQALGHFDWMVKFHAGDRATLDALAQFLNPDNAQEEILQQARKQAFLGNRGTWGAQVTCQFAALAVSPSLAEVGQIESLHLGGLLGFQRIRRDIHWRLLNRPAVAADDQPALEPIQPSPANASGAPLLAEFCSNPSPPMDVVRHGDEVSYLLCPGKVGLAGEQNAVYALKATHPRQGPAARPQLRVPLTTPAEHLEMALLVHRDLAPSLEPRLQLEGLLDGGGNGLDPLVPRDLASTPTGLDELDTAAAPRLANTVRSALESIGWNPGQFDLWRYQLDFPPIPAAAVFAT